MVATVNASTSSGVIVTSDTSGALALQTANTTAMTIDTSQNVGIGVTPGSTSASGTFQMKAGGDISFLGNGNISSNTYYNGTNYIYATTAASTRYRVAAGQHEWYNAPSGTAGSAITFTQAMTLDPSGNLGIGTSSPGAKLEVAGTTSGTFIFNTTTTAANGYSARSTGGQFFVGIDDSSGVYYNTGTAYGRALYSTGNYPMVFSTNSTERMRLDSSGNLGLGVTPSAWASGTQAIQNTAGALWGYSTQYQLLGQNYFYNGSGVRIYSSTAQASEYRQNAGIHSWYTAASGTAGNTITFTQAMTLDASGNLLVGTTTAIDVTSGTADGQTLYNGGRTDISRSAQPALNLRRRTSDGSILQFLRDTTTVGTISVTTSATSYNTSSDYRLKNTIAPMTGALAKVAQLKPVTYKWNVDGSDGEGFIAHELAEVCPHAVNGEKDAVDADGKPVYQGIDVSFLVATLTASIQELSTLITAQQSTIQSLTERITALEGART